MPRRAGGGLPRLTALRALAAAWVFGYHLGFNLRLYFGFQWFADGYAGVAFFFVLSGFVLTWAARPGEGAGGFYRRRVARIYPTYVVATIVALAVTPATVHAAAATFGLVQSWFAVVPAGARTITFPVNPPSWSLSCEAAFYLVFPLLMWARRRLDPERYAVALAAAALLCLEGAVLALRIGSIKQGPDIAYFTPFIRFGEFALGSALCVAMQAGWRPRIPLPVATVITVAAAVVIRHHGVPIPRSDLILEPFFALLIAAAAAADLDDRPGLLRSRPLVYAGEISYAFYIIQYPLLVEALRLGHTPVRSSLIALALTVAAAVALHHLVERPFQRLLTVRRPTRLQRVKIAE